MTNVVEIKRETDPFDDFWRKYPRKIGKLKAREAYRKALRLASHDDIIQGLDRFLQNLPHDRQFIPFPATWLNQGRWDDEYEEASTRFRFDHL